MGVATRNLLSFDAVDDGLFLSSNLRKSKSLFSNGISLCFEQLEVLQEKVHRGLGHPGLVLSQFLISTLTPIFHLGS